MEIEEKGKNLSTGKEDPKKVSKKTVNKKIKSKVASLKPILSKDSVKLTDFNNLNGKFLLVRVGNEDHPADDLQIKDIQEKLIGLFEKNNVNCVTFVTHHRVSVEIF